MLTLKKVYSIILTPVEEGYIVYVPDLNINTQGINIPDAIDMARDAIGLWGICKEDIGETIPEPKTLKPEAKADDIVTLVDIDFREYRRKEDNRMVRKNLTIPNYLNRLAEKEHINFSAVLQEALKSKLGLD